MLILPNLLFNFSYISVIINCISLNCSSFKSCMFSILLFFLFFKYIISPAGVYGWVGQHISQCLYLLERFSNTSLTKLSEHN